MWQLQNETRRSAMSAPAEFLEILERWDDVAETEIVEEQSEILVG
jgi:hypothetical protein